MSTELYSKHSKPGSIETDDMWQALVDLGDSLTADESCGDSGGGGGGDGGDGGGGGGVWIFVQDEVRVNGVARLPEQAVEGARDRTGGLIVGLPGK
ncbi:hypothetical protein Neosp_007805 [[Neocosmospora] mangrovei]